MPSTLVGSGSPAASRTVGATSMQWVNWLRTCVSGRILLGQATTIGSRAPPRWLAICLPHWNGVLLACRPRSGEMRRRVIAAELLDAAVGFDERQLAGRRREPRR